MTSPVETRFVPTEYITIPRTEILALKDAAKNSDAGIAAGLLGLAIPCLINAVTNVPESGLGEGNVFVRFILNLLVGIVCLIFGAIMAYKAWEKRGKFNEQLKEIDEMPLVQMNVSQGILQLVGLRVLLRMRTRALVIKQSSRLSENASSRGRY